VKIRLAVQEDLEAIAALHIESCTDAYAHVFPAEFLEERLPESLRSHWDTVAIRSEDLVLVAEEDAFIGFVAVWCRPSPFIDNLHVRPSDRSKKTGSTLMAAAAEQLIRRAHKTAHLWVFECNSGAIRFYRRLGGVLTERAERSVFGYNVMSRKIVWSDITSIVESVG
jgi:ribosomal protein S18 acetylase RimI-like enzyme